MKPNDIIRQFKSKSRQSHPDYAAQLREQGIEHRQNQIKKHHILTSCRPATAEEYSAWLYRYIKNGGSPTHFYDRKLDSGFFTAHKDFDMYPLFGAQSINIIVPVDIKVKPKIEIIGGVEVEIGADIGHNNLYFMETFKNGYDGKYYFGGDNGVGWVPLYNDVCFDGMETPDAK